MRIRYLFRLKEPVRIEDHWPVPLMNGQMRVICAGTKATGFEVTFTGQSVDVAPHVQRHNGGGVAASITMRDSLLPFVRMRLERTLDFLKCYFAVEISFGEIDAWYEAETPEEEGRIPISHRSLRKNKTSLHMPYDLLTRALMAAEKGEAPAFEATLLDAARAAMLQGRFIDSFRYSFLLIEALYGEGKFKSAQLKGALKANAEFKALVAEAMKERLPLKRPRNSDTERLLSQAPDAEAVIDHLVDRRGFYFHGNRSRKDAWKPHEQESAEPLCLLALAIAMLISHHAAAPMFDEALSELHFANAKDTGAIMTMKVDFHFRDPAEAFDRTDSINIRVPGTKLTPKLAAYVAKHFLERFADVAPMSDLKSAHCTEQETGQKVFDLTLHVGPADGVDESSSS